MMKGILSDNGGTFTAEEIPDICNNLNVTRTTTNSTDSESVTIVRLLYRIT